MDKIRPDHELPESVSDWGWKYHHLGIPTKKKMPEETYLPQFKFYVSGFSTSPFGIEWMRFEKGSPISKLIQTVPHITFEVAATLAPEIPSPQLGLGLLAECQGNHALALKIFMHLPTLFWKKCMLQA
jgi:hypothetical protein